jgi:hypothetical protein
MEKSSGLSLNFSVRNEIALSSIVASTPRFFKRVEIPPVYITQQQARQFQYRHTGQTSKTED